jgi:hypothetical protein
VRVALAAQAARDAGGTITADDVAAKPIEPAVYVALRWYCCDGNHGDSLSAYHPLTPFDYRIVVPGEPGPTGEGVTAFPLWVRRDLSLLKQFGGSPYPDVVQLAAYPLWVLSQPTDFVVYRRVKEPSGTSGTLMERGRSPLTICDVGDDPPHQANL